MAIGSPKGVRKETSGTTSPWVSLPRFSLAAFVMAMLVVSGTVAGTALKILQWNRWEFGVWDGGIYLQALWLLAQGHLRAVDTFFPTPKPIGADAGQWILYGIAPVLALAGTWGLFFLQALALCSPGWAFFDIARRWTGRDSLALAAGAAYLFFPATVGMAVFDWHADAIGVSLLSWALWAHATGKRRVFWPLLVLALLSKNQAAVPVLAFGLLLLLRREDRRRGLTLMALSLLSLWVDEFLVKAQDGNIATFYAPYGSSLSSVIRYLFWHPQVILTALWAHAGYLLAMTLPLLLLPFLSPLWSLPGLLVLLENALSPAATLTSLYDQYADWAVPFLMLGAIAALRRLPARGQRAAPLLAGLWLAVTGVNLLAVTVPNQLWRVRFRGSAALSTLSARVPAQAVFYGQSGTAAHFFNRPYVGSLPFDSIDSLWRLAAAQGRMVPTALLYAPGQSFGQISPISSELRRVGRILGTGGFSLVGLQHGIYLWKSRWSPQRLLRAVRGGRYLFPKNLLFPTRSTGVYPYDTAFNAVALWGGSYRMALSFRTPPPVPPSWAVFLLPTTGSRGAVRGPSGEGALTVRLPVGRLTRVRFQVSLPGPDLRAFAGIQVRKEGL